ncbi:hypothetical protein [Streptomyces ureilyticus]|uniref:Uncharacterized protein n=1 Tax=Streptomyces ureilyticus TaxID=1775131 RepID=A0ABX0DMH7_9ACTN|nr:hypothetical protein [Streptomyces ureilyticus]NGO43075.1 hypothetical protein [Streptomyces ureilyticus]
MRSRKSATGPRPDPPGTCEVWAALGDGEDALGDVDGGVHVAERQALAVWLVNGTEGPARAPDAGPVR